MCSTCQYDSWLYLISWGNWKSCLQLKYDSLCSCTVRSFASTLPQAAVSFLINNSVVCVSWITHSEGNKRGSQIMHCPSVVQSQSKLTISIPQSAWHSDLSTPTLTLHIQTDFTQQTPFSAHTTNIHRYMAVENTFAELKHKLASSLISSREVTLLVLHMTYLNQTIYSWYYLIIKNVLTVFVFFYLVECSSSHPSAPQSHWWSVAEAGGSPMSHWSQRTRWTWRNL